MPKYYVNHFDQVHNLIYLAFLAYYLTPEESVQFIKKLSMPKSWKQIVRDTISVRSIIPEITRINLKESSLFKYLRGHCYEAILANRLLTKSECAKKRLDKFIKVLQYMKPELSGFELQKMGVPNGPLIGQLLSEIMVQKLDGLIKSKKEEVKLIENATNPKGLSFDIDHRSGGPESGI
jgi:tRNA nucleotidyltransferase (CCA-adding enzyme)